MVHLDRIKIPISRCLLDRAGIILKGLLLKGRQVGVDLLPLL